MFHYPPDCLYFCHAAIFCFDAMFFFEGFFVKPFDDYFCPFFLLRSSFRNA